MLGCIDMPRPEQDREGGHREGDDQGRVDAQAEKLKRQGTEQRGDGKRHGFQLQRDVGKAAGDGDDGHEGTDGLALAVARGQEVGDRGDVLALRHAHNARDQAPPEREQKDRPEVDGEELVARRRGIADAAEERPGRAIDGKGKGVDQRPAAAALAGADGPVRVPGEHEQPGHVRERKCYDRPALDHGWPAVCEPCRTAIYSRVCAACDIQVASCPTAALMSNSSHASTASGRRPSPTGHRRAFRPAQEETEQ